MEPSSELDILFVLNPVSGGRKKIDWEPLIRNYFKSLSLRIEFFVLEGKDDASSIQYWIKKLSPTKVVAVGGDGTISLVAKQLLGSSICMGILRGGSANGMATELNIPVDPDLAMNVIANGKVQICDIIKINDDDICIHLSDVGLNARLIKYFDKGSFRGMWGYARVFLKILWQGQLLKVQIVADNLDITVSAYMIVIANASKYGTGAVINPNGLIHDGKFELVIVRRISIIEFIKLFLNNKPFNPDKVEIFQTTKAVITTKKLIHFQVDGEYKGKVKNVRAEIIPSAINLLIEK
ncbi:MAG TPA: diacylglycerol kinase family protein [Hanamia sp.]|nr:diacylglycerol kinase family protein [Hanamia sp.]